MGRANGLHIGARRRGGPYKACLIGWRHTTQVWVYAARKRQLRSLRFLGTICRKGYRLSADKRQATFR